MDWSSSSLARKQKTRDKYIQNDKFKKKTLEAYYKSIWNIYSWNSRKNKLLRWNGSWRAVLATLPVPLCMYYGPNTQGSPRALFTVSANVEKELRIFAPFTANSRRQNIKRRYRYYTKHQTLSTREVL